MAASHSQCKASVMPALGGRGPGLMVPGRGGGGRRSSMYPGSSMGGGGGGGLIPPPPSSVINSRRHSSRSGDIGYFNFIIKPGSNNVRVSTRSSRTETEVARCSPKGWGNIFFIVGSLNLFAGVTAALLPTHSSISLELLSFSKSKQRIVVATEHS